MSDKKAKVPQLRFAGFTGDWEERKLGDVLDEMKSGLSRMLSNDDIGLPVVRANNVNEGSLNMVDDVKYWYVDDPQGANTSNYLVHKNDILVNFINSEAKMGTATIVDIEPHRDTIYTTNIMKLKVNSRNDPYFVFNQTFCQKYKNYVKSITKPAVNQASFTTVDFKKFEFFAPNNEEQARVGAFLTNLDNLITLQQRQLDQLASVKKTMLEKMFPKDGANVPEIRFAGFTGAWEERKLGEVTNRFDNLRVPITASERVPGNTPYYGANGIQDYVEGYTHEGEFILVAEDGASDLKNYPVQYVNGRIWVNNHAHVLQAKKEITVTKFLKYAISQTNIVPYLVGGGRAKLNAEIMMGIDISCPRKIEEQLQLSCYFEHFDTLLTLHQREINTLKTLKKSMLQQLFV